MMHEIPPGKRHLVLVSLSARDLKAGDVVVRPGRSLEFLPIAATRVSNDDQIHLAFEGPNSVTLQGDFDVWVVKEGYTL